MRTRGPKAHPKARPKAPADRPPPRGARRRAGMLALAGLLLALCAAGGGGALGETHRREGLEKPPGMTGTPGHAPDLTLERALKGPPAGRRSLILWTEGEAEGEGRARAEALERAAGEAEAHLRTQGPGAAFALSAKARPLGEASCQAPAPGRARCRLRAEVFFSLSPPAAAAPGDDPLMRPGAPLTVSVRPERNLYRKGEEIVLRLRVNKPAHVRLVAIGPKGGIFQLLPNAFRKESLLAEAGRDHLIPDPVLDRYRIRVTGPPYGKETFILYASTAPLPAIPLEGAGAALGRFAGSRAELEVLTRRVGAEKAPPAEFFETETTVQTRP